MNITYGATVLATKGSFGGYQDSFENFEWVTATVASVHENGAFVLRFPDGSTWVYDKNKPRFDGSYGRFPMEWVRSLILKHSLEAAL